MPITSTDRESILRQDLQAKIEALEAETENGISNANSALWQDNEMRLVNLESSQKQVQNQLERLVNNNGADQIAFANLTTEVMKVTARKNISSFTIITRVFQKPWKMYRVRKRILV